MGKVILNWSLTKTSNMIKKILENKFDAFIIIEGNRGLGKSTLAIHLARRVARLFKNEGSTDYKFHFKHSFIFTRKETKSFLHKWKSNGIADEMINVTFNRDFYNEDQKDIIKMMNMNRDHCNLFIACVPSFQTLDTQIKNLCKIRITVVRRGLAIIQTPNQTIYCKDKWDQATNEKIEREWMKKGTTRPHYTKLSTFRGILKFPALRPKSEAKYQTTKNDKRNIVANEQMGIKNEEEKEKDPTTIAIKMLKEGKVRNGTFLDGLAQAFDLNPTSFKNKIGTRLKKQGEEHRVGSYYWEKKAQKKDEREGIKT